MSAALRAWAIALAACSSSPATSADGGVDGGDGGELDLASAVWEATPVGVVPGYAGGATLAIGGGGEITAAWSELDTVDFGSERPAFASSSADDFAPRRVTPEAGAEATSTHLAAGDGDVMHLVFSAAGASGNTDIFYVRRSDGTWSAPVDLTGAIESGARRDTEPVVVAGGGQVAVIYLSAPETDALSPGVHLVRFADGGAPSAVEVLIDDAGADCDAIDAAMGGGGAIHAVAACADEAGAITLRVLSDRSGAFVAQTAALGPGVDPRNPSLALGPTGAVHLAWDAEADCGGVSCRDVFHSRDLAPPVSVTGGSEDGGGFAAVAVLPGGEIVAAFHRPETGDLHWSYAEGGQGFVRVQVATPSTPDTLEVLIGEISVAPDGRPHMVFIRDLMTSDPIEADVVAAALR
jgi:hypothetical protein